MAAFLAVLVIILLTIIYTFAAVAFRAYVLTYLWEWFVVPFGLAQISLWHAAGVSLLIAIMTHQHIPGSNKDKTTEEKALLFLQPFLLSAMAWGFGYLYHTWM